MMVVSLLEQNDDSFLDEQPMDIKLVVLTLTLQFHEMEKLQGFFCLTFLIHFVSILFSFQLCRRKAPVFCL